MEYPVETIVEPGTIAEVRGTGVEVAFDLIGREILDECDRFDGFVFLLNTGDTNGSSFRLLSFVGEKGFFFFVGLSVSLGI